jgi:hypothetical protein
VTADPRERLHRLAAYAALRVVLERVGGAGVRRQRILRPEDIVKEAPR